MPTLFSDRMEQRNRTPSSTGFFVMLEGADVSFRVTDKQVDNSLNPGASPGDGDKYWITDSTSLHANFGSISGLANNDIVRYDIVAGAFVVYIDVSLTANFDGSFMYLEDDDVLYYLKAGVWTDLTASGDITGVTIQTDSGSGSKATDTSGSADFILQGDSAGIDVTNSGTTITVALDLNEIGAGVVADGDSFIFVDANDSNTNKKEAIADLATKFAGDGLTASSSVMAVNVDDSTIETSSDAIRVKDDGVTYAKIQNVSADERILGRVSGADGVIEELDKAAVLTMLNVADGATAGGETNEYSFKTITFGGSASAQSDVVADADDDTLTLVAGANVTITTTADQITFVATDTNTMGAGFVLEDGDGTEVTITESKEVKFVEGGGIDINWTDVSPGSDADPYDLTFTVADTTVAGDSGSTGITPGDTLTIAGGTACDTAMVGDTLTINATNTMGSGFTVSATTDTNATTITQGDDLMFTAGTGITCETTADGTVTISSTVTDTNTMGSGFVLEDGDGTEVTITENKEVKFVEGTGIDINWTDVSPGSDADPYDLTFTCNLEGTELISTGETGGSKFLRENGDGTCGWETVSGGVSLSGSTNNTVATVTGSNALIGEANMTFDGSALTITGNVFVDGGADVNQVKIQGHSTQTASPFLVEQSGGTDVFEVQNTGKVIGAAGAEFKGNSFTMGSSGGSTNFLHATGANNLNFRNHNANKLLQFDYPLSSGNLNFRTHDGTDAVTMVSLDSAGVWTHNVAMVATADAVFKGDTDADLLVVDAGGEKVGVGIAAGSMRHKFDCRGSRGYANVLKTDDYTLTVDDAIVYADASSLGMGQDLTITLPTIARGRIYEVYRRDDGTSSATVSVKAPSGTFLNGSDGGSVSLGTQYDGVRVVGIHGTDDWIAHEMHAVTGGGP